jgi:ribosomal-protein-alanine N-acetyltransferase
VPDLIRIEPLAEAHLTEVLRLERLCFPDPWSPGAFRAEIRRANDGAHNRVVTDDGLVRGYSIAWFVADEGHLANIAVDPGHRRRGLARVLLEDLIAAARRRAIHAVWLEVRVGNEGAIELYRRHGFVPAGVRKNYYVREHEDALLMVLVLGPEEGKGALVQPQTRRTPAADEARDP